MASSFKMVEVPEKDALKKVIFAEFLGQGPFLSINYDTRLRRNQNNGFGLRGGIGAVNNYISNPLAVNYIFGKSVHGFEVYAGVTSFIKWQESGFANNDDQKKFEILPGAGFGYRLQSNNGFALRLTNSMFVANRAVKLIWPGLSIGYGWK